MSHITSFFGNNAYEPLNKLNKALQHGSKAQPKIGLWAIRAESLDLHLEDNTLSDFPYTQNINKFHIPKREHEQLERAVQKALDRVERHAALFPDAEDVCQSLMLGLIAGYEYKFARDLPEQHYNEIVGDVPTLRQRIAHKYGIKADGDFHAECMPVYGTAFRAFPPNAKGTKTIDRQTIERWEEQKECSMEIVDDLRQLGVNAIYYQDYIFVPSTKISFLDNNSDLPYSEADTQSRPLMLAYLLHKELLDPIEDDAAIQETFPKRDIMLAQEIDVECLLSPDKAAQNDPLQETSPE